MASPKKDRVTRTFLVLLVAFGFIWLVFFSGYIVSSSRAMHNEEAIPNNSAQVAPS